MDKKEIQKLIDEEVKKAYKVARLKKDLERINESMDNIYEEDENIDELFGGLRQVGKQIGKGIKNMAGDVKKSYQHGQEKASRLKGIQQARDQRVSSTNKSNEVLGQLNFLKKQREDLDSQHKAKRQQLTNKIAQLRSSYQNMTNDRSANPGMSEVPNKKAFNEGLKK